MDEMHYRVITIVRGRKSGQVDSLSGRTGDQATKSLKEQKRTCSGQELF